MMIGLLLLELTWVGVCALLAVMQRLCHLTSITLSLNSSPYAWKYSTENVCWIPYGILFDLFPQNTDTT